MATRASQRVAKEIADMIERPPTIKFPNPGPHTIFPIEVLQRWLLLLAPPRKKPIRRSKTSLKSRATVKELDALCREIVFQRDGGCRFCRIGIPGVVITSGAKQFQWCHIFSRRYKWMRWDLSNSLTLCAGHHLWQHHNPLLATPAVEQILGRQEMRRLKMLASKPRKVSPELVRAYLEGERKKLS